MAISSLPPQLLLQTQIQNQGLGTGTLKIGQTFTGQLLSGDNKSLMLQIGNQTVSASLLGDSAKQLPLGRPLQFQIQQLHPQVVFKVINETTQADAKAMTLQTALRQILPNQISLASGINQLQQLVQSGGLPVALQSQLTVLLESLLKPRTQLSGNDLKQALLNSGLFFEANALKQPKQISQDTKGRLLKLWSMAQSAQNTAPATPNSMLKALSDTTEKMINRITHQQIQSMETPNQLFMELPLNHRNHVLNLSIELRKQDWGTHNQWEFLMTLQLEDGELVAKTVMDQEGFSFYFWADTPELESRLETALSDFQTQLVNSGLNVNKLILAKARPEASVKSNSVALIDLHI